MTFLLCIKATDIGLTKYRFTLHKKNTMQNKQHFIGLKIRTSNQGKQAAKDIPALWDQFLSKNLIEKIPNRVDPNITCVYAEYDGDHNLPYSVLLGCKVSDLYEIPAGMEGMSFESGKYETFWAKGDLNKGIVYDAWLKIWDQDIQRTYEADFEIYGPNAVDPTNAEVEIKIGVVG